ncbi:MAG: hypothetical protein ACYC9O_08670 [Candidatus Latescibacterota bacterium]
MKTHKKVLFLLMAAVILTVVTIYPQGSRQRGNPNAAGQSAEAIERMIEEGKQIYRYDTFGDEAFWSGALRLHEAILGAKNGGVGPGLSPKAALDLGLKVDSEALAPAVVQSLKQGKVDLNDPATTVALLSMNAVVGVKAIINSDKEVQSVGITCALCHSTVDNSFTNGIGKRLDGWPNRDLDVGAIVSLAPNLQPLADRLNVDVETVRAVLKSWGPGRYDAELNMDGKAFRPDKATGATLLPAAFGLAGVNLHTYSGWGSVPYWNAYVAITQMRGQGTFYDPRLNDPKKFPLAVRSKEWNIRPKVDLVSDKLPALHLYQVSIPAPSPSASTRTPTPAAVKNTQAAADRGQSLFNAKAGCARCHVPPAFTEPGWSMHTGAEIGIDNFQAERSPYGMYRTTPLKGLFTRAKGGFYHDGRFKTLMDVVNHYNTHFNLRLTNAEKNDLVAYLSSL